jgi:hypothetical protein
MSEKKTRKKVREKKNEKIYLVDYDLPQKNKKCRQEFYRKISTPKFKTNKSTNSVILTNDKKKAKALHRKASSCGTSNIYSVRKMK